MTLMTIRLSKKEHPHFTHLQQCQFHAEGKGSSTQLDDIYMEISEITTTTIKESILIDLM